MYEQCVYIAYFKFDLSMILFYKKLMYDPLNHNIVTCQQRTILDE